MVPSEKLAGMSGHWPGSQDGFCAAGSLLLLCVMEMGLGSEPPGKWWEWRVCGRLTPPHGCRDN